MAVCTANRTSFRSTCNEVVATLCDASPFLATAWGEHVHDCGMEDYSPSGRRAWTQALKSALAQLNSVDEIQLTVGEQCEFDHLKSLVDLKLKKERELLLHLRDPDMYVRKLCWALYGIVEAPGPRSGRGALLAQRLAHIESYVTTATANLKTGYDIPRAWADLACARLQALDAYFKTYLLPFSRRCGKNAEAVEEATEGARRKLLTFANFIVSKLMPRCDGMFAAGRSFYELSMKQAGVRIKVLPLLERATAAQSQWRSELERLHLELALAPNTEQTNALLVDKQLATTKLPAAYTRELANTLALCKKTGLIKDMVFKPEVRKLPPFAHLDSPSSQFTAREVLSSPVGRLLLSDLSSCQTDNESIDMSREHCTHMLRIRAICDGFPGAALLFSSPAKHNARTRRLLRSRATIAGWSLFALDIAADLGMLNDPKLQFFAARERLRAATLLTLDLSLHLQMTTIDEAVSELVHTGLFARTQARRLARRMSINAGWAGMAYAGYMELRQVRAAYAHSRGDRFDPIELYKKLLRLGTLPPAALTEALRR